MTPGLHRVRSRLAGGRSAEYWYAWRGGPRILKAVAASPAALALAVAEQAPAAIAAFSAQQGRDRAPDSRFLAGLIAKFLRTVEASTTLAPRTKADYRAALDFVRAELGTLEIKALESRRARSILVGWRDKYMATPKTADTRLGALAMVLAWAKNRGDLERNPLDDWPRLYKVNRADLIWEPAALARLLPKVATAEARDAMLFAAYTGLRLSDLVILPRTAVKDHAIVWHTGKSRGRRTVIVPITGELPPILDRLQRRIAARPVTTLLVNSRGKPWTGEGLQTSMQKAKQALKDEAIARGGPEARSGVEELRFHDLRGTAATNLVRAGLALEDVATILGWEKRRVEAIAARYVTGEAIALAIVERMKRAHTP